MTPLPENILIRVKSLRAVWLVRLIQVKGRRRVPAIVMTFKETEQMTEDPKTTWKTLTEEIEVAGHQLVDQVTRLLAEGNVRQLQIRSESGDVYLSVPLTAGAIVGGVMVIAAPWLAVIGAIAGLVAKIKIVVVRDVPPPDDTGSDTGERPSGGD